MSIDWFSNEFWLELRKKTCVKEGNGKKLCLDWCNDALSLLEESIFQKEVAILGEIHLDQYAVLELVHYWLETNYQGERYIADGTAGQFDTDFPEGYYGLLKKAPESLKKIYLQNR